jgi:hypothetical protein
MAIRTRLVADVSARVTGAARLVAFYLVVGEAVEVPISIMLNLSALFAVLPVTSDWTYVSAPHLLATSLGTSAVGLAKVFWVYPGLVIT